MPVWGLKSDEGVPDRPEVEDKGGCPQEGGLHYDKRAEDDGSPGRGGEQGGAGQG